jgi:hypothetical protein
MEHSDPTDPLRLLHLPDGGQGENNEHHDSHRR